MSFEKNNILVEYKIVIDTAECSLSLHEIIEILGILLTNAAEVVYKKKNEEKRISLKLEENRENLIIEVGNPSEHLKSNEIERLFHEGYSSKGEGRGIGLARIKQLVADIVADIIVENRTKSGSNWIIFKIIIPIRKR